MKSKTSCFEKTIFKKNLTRFAPVMGLYTLCLVLGMVMLYQNNRNMGKSFWFASRMAGNIQIMGFVNLFFAPLVAMLLFGDLYNSRMCNALHAMPVRRETLFVTNVVSGLLFSLIPTAVMALLSLPLLNATVVTNAWQIGLLWFLGANLQFIAFFGIAVFSVFCTGNRFAMAAVYAVLNFGAYILYFIISTIYTPMLFGVVTPSGWANLLTPVAGMTEEACVQVQDYNELCIQFMGREREMVASFSVDGGRLAVLAVWAAVGVVFAAVGLLLYRRRDLECAGDAIAFPVLRPVFQVVCAVAGGALAVLAAGIILSSGGSPSSNALLYFLLFCGIFVGWFGAKMFLARSTRVFGLRSWAGLGILAAVAAVSLLATYFDVLGIENRIPDPEDVQSVTLSSNYNYSHGVELTQETDINQMTTLHAMALQTHIEDGGSYPLSYILSREEREKNVSMPEEGFYYGDGGYSEDEPALQTDYITLSYKLKNGHTMTRCYYIWANLEQGTIVNEYMSRWEQVWQNARSGYQDTFVPSEVTEIRADGKVLRDDQITPELTQSLLDAVRADCDERTMNQDGGYHCGYFREYDDYDQDYYKDRSVYVSLWAENGNYSTGASFSVFADSVHTVKWLQEHGLLTSEVVPEEPIKLD